MDPILLVVKLAFVFSTLLLIWIFAGYNIVLQVLSKLIGGSQTQNMTSEKIQPSVSIIIPTFNEEVVIKEKIMNTCNLDYPKEKMEIIVVDSNSNDNTGKLAQKIAEKYSNIKVLIEKERRGKISALNHALKYCDNDIIVVSDVNTQIWPESLQKLVSHFRSDKVGAVAARIIYCGKTSEQISKEEQTLWDIDDLMYRRESNIDSIPFLKGELFAFRKKLIQKIDEESIADDIDITFQIRKQGYKIDYAPEAIACEVNPVSLEELRGAKIRRYVNAIRAMMKHKNLLFNPRYGLFGLLILPSHKFIPSMSPFLFLTFVTTLVIDLVWGTFFPSSYSPIPSIPLTSLVGLTAVIIGISVFFIVRAALMKSYARSPLNLRKIWELSAFFFSLQYSLIIAWKQYLTHQYKKAWKIVKSNRVWCESECWELKSLD